MNDVSRLDIVSEVEKVADGWGNVTDGLFLRRVSENTPADR
ncbi:MULTISPECIES: hypothetical protein [unclassified Streptomyces]|nr:hypothetical protein [Streptomyces sp. NBC_01439]